MNKRMVTLKRNQKEILELKSKITEVENSRGTWLPQSVEHSTLDLGVVSLSPTVV